MMKLLNFFQKAFVISEMELRKIFHDPTEIFTRAVQPVLWLLIFGQVFARMRALAGQTNYIDFMTPGIMAQSVLFISIFSGIAIIWERDLGLIHKLLATPTPRTAIVLGKAISAGLRTLPVVIIIYLLAILMKVHIEWAPLNLLGVFMMVMLGSIILLDVFTHNCLSGKNAGTIHGNRANTYYAVILRKQCNLPYRYNAGLVKSNIAY